MILVIVVHESILGRMLAGKYIYVCMCGYVYQYSGTREAIPKSGYGGVYQFWVSGKGTAP